MKGNTKGDLEIIIQTRQLQYDDSKTHVTQNTGIAIVHRIRLRSLRTIFVTRRFTTKYWPYQNEE